MRTFLVIVLGLVAGMIGAMLQTYVLRVGNAAIPVGAVAVLIVLLLIARACAWWIGSRTGAILLSVPWLIATLAMATTTPGGDLVINAGPRQALYVLGGSMLLAAACGFPLLPEDDSPVAVEPGR